MPCPVRSTGLRAICAYALLLPLLLGATRGATAQAPRLPAIPPAMAAAGWAQVDAGDDGRVFVESSVLRLEDGILRTWIRVDYSTPQVGSGGGDPYTQDLILIDVECRRDLQHMYGESRIWTRIFRAANGSIVERGDDPNAKWVDPEESPAVNFVDDICTQPVRNAGAASGTSTSTTGGAAAAAARVCGPTDVSRSIAPGLTARGVLDVSDCVRSTRDRSFAEYYRLVLAATTVLQFDLTSTEFDAHLAVLDAASGRLIGSGSSVGTSTDSRLIDTLSAGTYHVVANSYRAGEKGRYALTVQRYATASGTSASGTSASGTSSTQPRSCTSADSRRTVAVGDSVRGTLDASDCVFSTDGAYAEYYRLDLAVPSTVRFDLMSSAFDAFLAVYGAAPGSSGTSTDAGGAGTDARLLFSLDAGTHWIVVKAKERGQSGSYLLTLAAGGGGGGGRSTTTTTTTPARGTTSGTTVACSTATATRSMDIGSSVRARIEASDCRRSATDAASAKLYRIDVPARTTLQIDMTSAAFDAYAALLGAGGGWIAYDDDAGEGPNARLSHTVERGTYWVMASAHSAGRTGEFELTVREAAGSAAAAGGTATTDGTATTTTSPIVSSTGTRPAGSGSCVSTDSRGTIRIGAVVRSRLDESDCLRPETRWAAQYYRLELGSPATVQIDMTSTAFDAYLTLQDAQGSWLGRGDDDGGGGGTNARLTRALASGTYWVLATTNVYGTSGDFVLTVTGLGASVGTATTRPRALPKRLCTLADARGMLDADRARIAVDSLQPSDCVRSVSDTSYADYWRLTLERPITVRLDLSSADFNAHLAVLDGAGRVVAAGGSGGVGQDARITRSFPAGTHYIVANSATANETGVYTLTATRVDPSEATTSTTGGATATTRATVITAPACLYTGVRETLYVGETRGGTLDRSTCRQGTRSVTSFRLDVATAGTRVVDLESSDFDPYLSILDARGAEVATDDDSGDGYAARISRAFAPGTYYVVVRSVGLLTGEFTLKAR